MSNDYKNLQPRESVRLMRAYSPPTQGRSEMLRLDFNENTVGCSPAVTAAVTKALSSEQLAMYPEYSAATEQVATYLGVAPENLMFTNGTDEAIQVLINTFVESGDELVILHPSYAMYRFYAEVSGVVVREVSYSLADDLRFPLARLLEVVTPKTRAIFIANPNNPTGSAISTEQIQCLLDAAPHSLVLIDEAYVEFSKVSAISLVPSNSNLVISRTFSKAFGLAGLRCGCIVSSASNIAWACKAQSPYSVNVVAVRAVVAAVEDVSFMHSYVTEVLKAREYVVLELERMGIRYFPTDGNFVLIDVGLNAQRFVDALREKNILIRNRSHEISGCLRITIGTQKQMQRFVNELEKIL